MSQKLPYALVGLLAAALVGAIGYASVRWLTGLMDGEGTGYDPYQYEEPVQDGDEDPVVVYADSWPVDIPTPTRFWEPLPRDPLHRRVAPSLYPPEGHLEASMARGDPATQEALLEAMRDAARRGASPDTLTELYGGLVRAPATPEHCRWLRETLVGGGRLPMWDDLWSSAARCRGPTTDALFGGQGVPPAARIERLSLHWHGDPEVGDLDAIVRDFGVDRDALSRRIGARRDQLVRALVRCAAQTPDPDDATWPRADCLTVLARLDRHLAGATARALLRDDPETWFELREVATALTRFESTEALADRLRWHGLDPTPQPALDLPAAVGARDLLKGARRMECLDMTSDGHPPPHDRLLARLAHLARPALDGAVFEQLPGTEDVQGMLTHVVHAYAGGSRWRMEITDRGRRFNDFAVVGLLNAMLRHRGDPARIVVVLADPLLCVVAGPEQGLTALAEEGLLTLQGWDVPTPSADPAYDQRSIEELMEAIEGGGTYP